MARVAPFYSKQNPGVYHECSNCTEGNNIERKNRVSGTGGGRRCQHCNDLIKSKDKRC